jgi:SAM-dependent methyltransferase
MGSFPLLTAGELDGARLRWQARVPGSAAAALYENVERALVDPAFQAPLQLGLASNLFQIQGLLLELSLAYRCSGEERYLEPVRRCLAGFADERVRRARLPSEVHLSFVVVGLAVAHELCGEAIDLGLLQDTVATVVGELYDASSREEWGDRIPKRNAWNHTAVAYAAIGCGGMLCRGRHPQAEQWLQASLERVRLFFADGVTEEGMTREGLAYCGFVFRNFAPLLLAARNEGIWDYRLLEDNRHLERLRLVPRWYAIEIFPGGSWMQPINDSYWSPRRAMGGFLPVFGALAAPLTAWVQEMLFGARGDGTHGADRSMSASSLFESVLWPPAAGADEAAVELPEMLADPVVGYIAERVREAPSSGFSLNCGEYLGGIHDQSDNGSVTLFAGKVPVLIDSGAANDPVEGSASSSHGHNVVLIDGRGQFPAGGGAGCTGRIAHAESHALATVLTMDLTAAYDARGHNPVARAIRHCVFGKRPFSYLLIVDDFSRPGSQEAVYEQIFHTPPVAESAPVGGGVELRIEFEDAVATAILRPLDEGVTTTETTFRPHDLELFPVHAVWRLRRTGGHLVMPTLLLAYDGERPEVQSTFDARAGRITMRWEIAGRSGVDVVQLTPGSPAAAVLTRDGARLPGAERLLVCEPAADAAAYVATGRASGGVPPVRDAAPQPVDERALARRRRLRRLIESVDALDGSLDGDGRVLAPEGVHEEIAARGRIGRELLEQFVTLAELDPDAGVLDLECGTGQQATPLIHYLRWGSYTGFDHDEESVAWCRRELAPRNPRFRFELLDTRAPEAGSRGARHWRPPRLPAQDECCDFVVATSMFATAEIDERSAGACLGELMRVLRDDGAIFLATSLGDRGSVLDWLRSELPGVAESKAKLAVDRVAVGAFAGLSTRVGPDALVLRRVRRLVARSPVGYV